MQIYHYKPNSGEFLKEETAKLDPLETELQKTDVFLIPANATQKDPPAASAKKTAVFSGGNWSLVPDHRGETWYKAYNEPVVITEIGSPENEGLASVEPSAPKASVTDVKSEAGRRIDAQFPDYKQRNYIARQSELDRIETGTMRDSNGAAVAARSLTSEEISELVAIKGVWDWILSVRIASGVIEASPPDLPGLKTDARWPADPA